MLLRVIEVVAALSSSLFAGAALYINAAEHPARMGLDTAAAAAQWAPSYRRAAWLQAPLALVSCVSGLWSWSMGAGAGWVAAAILIGLVVPFTLLGVMPTNRELLAPGRDLASGQTRALLEAWGKLHAVRTVASLLATTLCLWLLSAAKP